MALAFSAKAGANIRAAFHHLRMRVQRRALRLSQPHANVRALTNSGVAIPVSRGVVSRAIFCLPSLPASQLTQRISRF